MRTAALFVATALFAAGPALAREEVQPWPTLSVSAGLGDGWQASGEVVNRIAADNARPSQLEYKLQLGHTLGKGVTLWLGYDHYDTYVADGRNGLEHQIFEQLNWAGGRIGPARLSSRTRLEQRFQRGAGGEVAWRIRQQVRVALPLATHGPSAVVWTEPFIELNRTPLVRRTIDQWRNFVGISLPVTPHADVELGYLNQYLFRPGRNASNDVIPLVVTIRY